jgi:hypothetical protein
VHRAFQTVEATGQRLVPGGLFGDALLERDQGEIKCPLTLPQVVLRCLHERPEELLEEDDQPSEDAPAALDRQRPVGLPDLPPLGPVGSGGFALVSRHLKPRGS